MYTVVFKNFQLALISCVASVAALSTLANAEVQGWACKDSQGRKIPEVWLDEVPGTAAAAMTHQGPVIFMSEGIHRLSPKMQLFIYMHECGHHVLGHTRQMPELDESGHRIDRPETSWPIEEAADCYALNHILELTSLSEAEMNEIADFFIDQPISGGHPDGVTRLNEMYSCMQDMKSGIYEKPETSEIRQ